MVLRLVQKPGALLRMPLEPMAKVPILMPSCFSVEPPPFLGLCFPGADLPGLRAEIVLVKLLNIPAGPAEAMAQCTLAEMQGGYMKGFPPQAIITLTNTFGAISLLTRRVLTFSSMHDLWSEPMETSNVSQGGCGSNGQHISISRITTPIQKCVMCTFAVARDLLLKA